MDAIRSSLVFLVLVLVSTPLVTAQTAARGQRTARPAVPAVAAPPATLNQLMRGIMFPNSNVIFAAQGTDPATTKQDADPSASVNPLASLYGGWEAVENSGLALAEASRLLSVPGRKCSNGRPAPLQNADWNRFAQGLREAGLAAARAARAKNQDQVLDVADKLTTACANCHEVYRDKTPQQGGEAGRCAK